jgi:hypothetical protein
MLDSDLNRGCILGDRAALGRLAFLEALVLGGTFFLVAARAFSVDGFLDLADFETLGRTAFGFFETFGRTIFGFFGSLSSPDFRLPPVFFAFLLEAKFP